MLAKHAVEANKVLRSQYLRDANKRISDNPQCLYHVTAGTNCSWEPTNGEEQCDEEPYSVTALSSIAFESTIDYGNT